MYIGIDLHKETCYATTLDKEGEIVDRREFKNEREEWEKFVEGIPRDSKVAIEACSYWYPVCDFLEERGIEMVLSHPSKMRIIAEAKIKTDKIDREILAKLLRADFLPQSYIPSKEIRENRELLRLRVQLGKDRTVVKNRIHALMAKNGVKHEFSDLFGVEGRIFLKEIELAESPHTGSASSSKISWRAKEILSAVEETEGHKESCGGDSEETAQGDILHADKKRKLPV